MKTNNTGPQLGPLETILQHTSEGVLAFDTNLVYVLWNSVMEKISGMSAEQVLGKKAPDLFPFLLETNEIEHFHQALRGQTVRTKEQHFQIPETGQEGIFSGQDFPLRDEAGRICGGAALLCDITEKIERREIEKKNQYVEARFNSLFNQAPLAIQIYDEKGYCSYVNDTWEELFATPKASLEGYNLFEDPQLKTSGLFTHIQRAYAGENVRTPPTLFNPSDSGRKGRQRWIELYIFPVYNPQNTREIAILILDLTDLMETNQLKHESEVRFNLLANSLPQMVWITDLYGNIEYINDNWFTYTGQPRQDVTRKLWIEVTHPDDVDEIVEKHLRAVETTSELNIEYRIRRSDGQYRWHLAKTVYIKDANGVPLKRFGMATDIDEQKKYTKEREDSLQTLATVNQVGQSLTSKLDLESITQTITDAGTTLSGAQFGAFFYNVINDEGETYLLYSLSGASREAFSKFPLPRATAVFHPTFVGAGTVRSDDITKDPRYGQSGPYNGMPEGHLPVRSYLAVSVISRSGEVLGGLFFGHAEVGRFTKQHEEIVEGLAAQTAIAMDNARLYKSLQESIKARDEFLSIASHELKTPLTTLTLQSQFRQKMIKKEKTFTAAELSDLFETDARQLKKINRLIDDMLDIARIRTGKLAINKERLDLRKLVGEVLERMLPQLLEACGEVRFPDGEPLMVDCDPFRIDQVISNLLTNCMKYGNGKPIFLGLGTQDGKALLSVRDQGIGISLSDQKRIFTKFERAISASEVSGLGLGLAITKDIIEAHGGSIRVESEVGKGAEFVVLLPF